MEEMTLFFIVAAVIIFVILGYFALRWIRNAPVGTTCSADANCNAGLLCDSTLKVCRAPPNSPCTSSSMCTSNSSCVGGVCVVNQTEVAPTPVPSPAPAVPTILTPAEVTWGESDCTSDTSCSTRSSETSWNTRTETSRTPFNSASRSTVASSTSAGTFVATTSERTPMSDKWRTASSRTPATAPRTSRLRRKSDSSWPSRYTPTSDYQPMTSGEESYAFQSELINELTGKSSIQDIIEYQSKECVLAKNGFLTYAGRSYAVPVRLERLEATRSRLFGVAAGICYQLDFQGSKIIARKITGLPAQITHTSSTRDGEHFWVQNDKEGWLCTEELDVLERHNVTGYRRNYGLTRKDYINSGHDNTSIEVCTGGEHRTKSVGYSVYGTSGSCILSIKNGDPYRDIRVLNQGVYWIVE